MNACPTNDFFAIGPVMHEHRPFNTYKLTAEGGRHVSDSVVVRKLMNCPVIIWPDDVSKFKCVLAVSLPPPFALSNLTCNSTDTGTVLFNCFPSELGG